MNISFSLVEMTSALEKIGYTIKLEKEVEVVHDYHSETEVERNVYNVYYRGEKITEMMFGYMWGTKRLEWVFEKEVHKRILGLF